MKNKDQTSWRQFHSLFKGHYRILGASLLGSIAQVMLVYPVIYLVRRIFDDAIPHRDARELILLGCLLIILNILQGGVNLWSKYTVLKVNKSAIQRFRLALLKKLFELSHPFYTNADRGKLQSVILKDTDNIDQMINAIASVLLPTFVTGFLLTVVLLYVNWLLALCVIAAFPILWWSSAVAAKNFKKHSVISQEAFGQFNKGILFLLRMITLTRIQSAEDIELERQEKNLRDLNEIGKRVAWSNTLFRVIHETSVSLLAIVILVVGGWMVLHGTLSVGQLMAFYFVLATLRGSLSGISFTIPQITAGTVSLNEISKVLNSHEPHVYGGTARPSLDGAIALESVRFSFGEKQLLQNASMQLRPGKITALVGPNGAGKSTIVNLILGFYIPDTGKIFAGNHPYSEIDMKHLRESIGVVLQDSPIFRGTIFENITYGNAQVSFDDVAAVAHLAAADEFIGKQNHGYETLVGEEGVLLSGGERQRISIARALLRRPKLLILDQLDDHLDRDALKIILSNIKRLDYSPACLLISHNPAVEQIADDVYILKNNALMHSRETLPVPSPLQMREP